MTTPLSVPETVVDESQPEEAFPSATLTIIRGAPGSGKSTLARALAESTHAVVFSLDQWRVKKHGKYVYDAKDNAEASTWMLTQTDEFLRLGWGVIVESTFVLEKYVQPYLKLAKRHKTKLQIIDCFSSFSSTHNVPSSTITHMKQNFTPFKDFTS